MSSFQFYQDVSMAVARHIRPSAGTAGGVTQEEFDNYKISNNSALGVTTTTANTAETDAGTAQARADDAWDLATDAETHAQTAITNAGTAQARADNAYALAGDAQTRADNAYTLADSAQTDATYAKDRLPISEYQNSTTQVTMSSTYATVASMVLTTTLASTPILVWSACELQDQTTIGGSTYNTQIVINTSPPQTSQAVTVTIPQLGGRIIVTNIFRGVGPATPGDVTIFLQARRTNNSGRCNNAQIMCLGNPMNA